MYYFGLVENMYCNGKLFIYRYIERQDINVRFFSEIIFIDYFDILRGLGIGRKRLEIIRYEVLVYLVEVIEFYKRIIFFENRFKYSFLQSGYCLVFW